ncbi:MAG: sigma-54 dependent transcriptional regulator [Deferribacterales bacterium]
MKRRILIIDDDESLCYSLKRVLSIEYSVLTAHNSDEAFKILKEELFDLILIDYRLGSNDGIEVLGEIKKLYPDTPVIMMTAYGTNNTLINSVRVGAEDFIFKPVDALELKRLIAKYIANEDESCGAEGVDIRKDYLEDSFIGVSKEIKDILKLVATISYTDSPVLITGESGTGKELMANLIQSNSKRSDKPYIVINCAAIPFELLESELFGYEKGAFSGAYKSKPGKFELADTGTIFLDEIGDLPYKLQSKLLRVLQDGMVEKLGSTNSKKVDVRIIAATNRELEQLVSDGKFRLDLFYRLNVINIHIPPLRDRKEDIVHLTHYFVNRYSKDLNKDIRCIKKSVIEKLENHKWLGNVRELQNVIKKAVILAKSSCINDEAINFLNVSEKQNGYENLVEWVFEKFPENTLISFIEYSEEMIIRKALQLTGYSKTKTAERLGISRVTLNEKLKKYNLNDN